METYLFTGTITTRQPLAYSPPDHQERNTKKSLLPRMSVPTAAGPMETVFVSGSTIRGKFRHACADVYMERERQRDRPVDYDRYLELKVGGVKGSADEERVGLRERRAFLDDNPFLDLFGAGSSGIGWIHSRLDMGAAIPGDPVEPVTLKGTRKDATLDPILRDVLNEDEIDKVLEGAQANRVRSQKAGEVRALKQEIRRAEKAQQDTANLKTQLRKAEKDEEEAKKTQQEILGTDVSLLLPLPGYEAIPAGVILKHRMFLKHVSPEQTRLFMAGVARFAEDPRFGAHRAHGCGLACVEYQVKRLQDGAAQPVGTVSIDPDRWDEDEHSLLLTGEPQTWLKEWHEPPDQTAE